MLLYLFLTLAGVVISFGAHFLLFLNIIDPPMHIIAAGLNIGLFVLVPLRILATKNLRQGDGWFYDVNIKHICPFWMKVSTGIIMGYGIVFGLIGLIQFLLVLVPALRNPTIPINEGEHVLGTRNLFNSVFLFLMACYCFEAMLNYSFRILKNTKELHANDFQGGEN